MAECNCPESRHTIESIEADLRDSVKNGFWFEVCTRRAELLLGELERVRQIEKVTRL